MPDLNKYKYLIMGANSFIGQNFYQELTKTVDPANIHTLSKGPNSNNFCNYIRCDVTDINNLEDKTKSIFCDIVLYFITATDKNRDLSNFNKIFDINFMGLKNTLHILKKRGKLKHFIYFSTAEVYGKDVFEPSENQSTSPISLYSLTKSLSEELLKFHINTFDLPITIIRPSNVYGEKQSINFFIPQAINSLLEKAEFDMTPGEQTRDFIHVDDVCKATINIIEQNAFKKDIINLSSNKEIKLKDLVLKIKELLKSKTQINFGAIPYRKNEIMRYKINNNKIIENLNWEPQISIMSGIKKIVKSVLDNEKNPG
jgi:nucleoside-diphosphate-sugar epimerase